MNKVLLCSDLDRTILPNGSQPESSNARRLLRRLAEHSEFVLAYVSGRNEYLLKKAIGEFELPVPDYAIGDVGTTIYEPHKNWSPWQDWAEDISRDWQGKARSELEKLFADITLLRLQESEKQNTYKISYYTDTDIDVGSLKEDISNRLAVEKVRASIIWSVDEEKDVGLLDILPERATKIHAIRFLMHKKGFSEDRTVFAGDSGNDLPALTSGLQAVLVKNARDDVRKEAEEEMVGKGLRQKLYMAQGDFLDMNGNYSAGVLEGLVHFIPETEAWMGPS